MSDLLMAIAILFFIIVLSASLWNRSVNSMRLKEERNEMENLVLLISDQLIKGLGIPSDWNKTNVVAIGLAKEDNILDPVKVSNFINLGTNKTKNILGIGNYNFIFRLRDINENILVEYGTPPINSNEVIIVRRVVLYQGRPTIMDFGLWK